jgi:acetyltransferase-like isoleucine patch superfamily enzyme
MPPRSHGTGQIDRAALKRCPASVVLEPGALVFHPENVSLDEDVYVGHYAILKGYHRNELVIGRGAWIGQAAFLHAAGGIRIGDAVGIGPHVCILTSTHGEPGRDRPIMEGALEFAPVTLDDGCDIGVGAVILPGVTIGRGAQVGAGAVVTSDVAPYAVVAGNPARLLRTR